MGGLDGAGRPDSRAAFGGSMFSCTPIHPLGFYFVQSNIVLYRKKSNIVGSSHA
jgi:hypothetical protein